MCYLACNYKEGYLRKTLNSLEKGYKLIALRYS
jgi:hypothetical protein